MCLQVRWPLISVYRCYKLQVIVRSAFTETSDIVHDDDVVYKELFCLSQEKTHPTESVKCRSKRLCLVVVAFFIFILFLLDSSHFLCMRGELFHWTNTLLTELCFTVATITQSHWMEHQLMVRQIWSFVKCPPFSFGHQRLLAAATVVWINETRDWERERESEKEHNETCREREKERKDETHWVSQCPLSLTCCSHQSDQLCVSFVRMKKMQLLTSGEGERKQKIHLQRETPVVNIFVNHWIYCTLRANDELSQYTLK